MKVATMRRLDRWLGIPACFLLTVLRRGGEILAPRRSKAGRVERVLVVKLAEQGATVLAYPALRRAVDRVGRENVYFFVFEENRFILDCLDVIPRENVIAVSTRGVLRTMASLLAGLARVRRIRVDAVADLEFFARSSAIISYLSGASIRAGLHKHHDLALRSAAAYEPGVPAAGRSPFSLRARTAGAAGPSAVGRSGLPAVCTAE
jgi:hypothetical protein